MNTTLIGLINVHAPEFSKGQRRIADFITQHYDEAAFMTAARLGGGHVLLSQNSYSTNSALPA